MSSTELGKAKAPASRSGQPRTRWTWGRALRWGVLLLLLLGGLYGARLGWSILLIEWNVKPSIPPAPTDVPIIIPVETETPEPTVGLGTPTHVPRLPATPAPTLTTDLTQLLPPGRVNILLLGSDKRANDPSTNVRSDTLILFSVDTAKKTVGILSLPRDLLAPIPGWGTRKINAAYAIGEFNKLPGGGPVLAAQTLSKFLGSGGQNLPIPYYVTINFEGFQKVVDTVGGIFINVPEAIDDDCYPTDWFGCEKLHFDAGYQYMDGATALKYARTRHADNDFARSRRQQQVILAVRQRALQMNMLPHLPDLLDQLGGMTETNIPLDKQLAFAQLAAGISATNIYTAQINSFYITAATDPTDGSQALAIDWAAARPMLNCFFGRASCANATPTPGGLLAPGSPTAHPPLTPAPLLNPRSVRIHTVPTRGP